MIENMTTVKEFARKRIKKSTLVWVALLGASFFALLSQVPFGSVKPALSIVFVGVLLNGFLLIGSLVYTVSGIIDLCSPDRGVPEFEIEERISGSGSSLK